MLVAPHAGHGRPGRRRGDGPRRRRDHRLRVTPRWRGRRDGDEARRQRGHAVLAAPRPVAEGPRRPREDPRRGRGDPPLSAAVPVPGPVQRAKSASSRAARCLPASPCCSSRARRPATRAPSSAPTSSTSNGRRASPSASAMACTAASGPRWRAWRAGSRSRSSRNAWRRLEVDEAGLRRVQMANVAGYSNVPVRAIR